MTNDNETGNKRHILVAEDNPVIRDLVRLAVNTLNQELDDFKIDLHEAADGATAWEKIQDTKFDLMILDIYIPVLDGLALIGRIRESKILAEVPILAISASIQDARLRCLGAGANEFMQKPLRAKELLSSLRSLLKIEGAK